MRPVHHESVFGDAIIAALLLDGWELGDPTDYQPDLGLDTRQLFTFIGATQPKEWEELVTLYGGDPDAAQAGFAKRLDQAITTDGVIDVLRKGVKDRGVRIRLAYFKPSYIASDTVLDDYRQNRLTVVRELPYATKRADHGKRLDLTLFLNGIPLTTAELKNPLTGSGVEQAIQQYRADRDPTELIFTRRVVANFAVDPHRVYVTTQLRGDKTIFLPFNTGSAGPGKPGGAGNPPPRQPGAYATSYLWEQIWQRDNWLELLERFIHVRKTKDANGRARRTIIFPRYHQWHAVKTLTDHAARHGAGHNYLIMASAGSGKSNTIAWLAHRLASLHTPADPAQLDPDARGAGLTPGTPVFDKIVIITDRRNLDAQLRETVGSFEQTAGLVVSVDERYGTKSEQLARALSQEAGKIVTVTLHTFPALVEYLKRNPREIRGRRFAIIIDEAHSSQTGDSAAAVRAVLSEFGLDADSDDPGAASAPADVDAALEARARRRGQSRNLSYFAFTATPKHKTLELFGTLGDDGKYHPFHTYSMRQAIEEGFILDPLRNYVTYATYYKLVNENPDEREVDPAKANPLLARYALTHDATVAQHAQVIIEHFRTHTAHRLGGRAKAMVVTASRQSAVQMSRALKRYIAEQGYPDPGVLVAFSGKLTYEGEETSESKENDGLPESALPKAFAYTRVDDKAARAGAPGQREYRILVVADKYQTGFDQPLLTTMYVIKKLSGVAAVQTLSRINRIAEHKSQNDLAVLDFVNHAEDIQEAFRPYYEEAATLPSDPNMLYVAQSAVMSANLLVDAEMQEFAAAWLEADRLAGGDQAKWQKLHAELTRHLTPAVDRFTALLSSDEDDDRETAEKFRADLNDYVNKYSFLAQIIPYTDAELERLYLYGRHLLNMLPKHDSGAVDLGRIDLSHLRVEKTGEHDLSLRPEGPADMRGFAETPGGARDPEKVLLSELIAKFNERYGTNLTDEDLIKPLREAMADPKVRLAAVVNDEEAFGHVFAPVFEEKVMDFVDATAEFGRRYFGPDREFRDSLNRSARSVAWEIIRRQEGLTRDVA